MLVLSRQEGERIVLKIDPSMVDREIVLTQVRISQHSSRLGIDAPAGVIIVREELLGESDAGMVPAPSAEVCES